MNTLYTLNEALTYGYKSEVLNIISLFAILSGVLVLVSKNPVVSVLFLISLFGSISVYLIILGLSFIGLSYLIVYIGAVSILFLFILMLINIRISELQNDTANSLPLATLILISLIYTIYQILPNNVITINNYNSLHSKLYNLYLNKNNMYENTYDTNFNFVTSNSWDINLIEVNHISSIGNILYTSHSIWLIITSFILLLSMVGAIVITIKNNKD